MARTKEPVASNLLLDEYFAAGDDRFLAELYSSDAEKRFKRLAERWLDDKRPWARKTLLAYIDDGCDRPHHRPLVKKLYKLAEENLDDELVTHFAVAFDRLPRRVLVRTPGAAGKPARGAVLRVDAKVPASKHAAAKASRFSARTRQYLCRRALRYLRTLGRADPARFRVAARDTLALYADAHLEKPEQFLDAWTLVHLLYWASPVLVRDPSGIRLSKGRALSELQPAPLHPSAWQAQFAAVLELLERARSGTVRGWTLALLKRDYEADLRKLPLARIRALLKSPHEEVQQLGATYLREAQGLAKLTVPEWLELLRIENVAALTIVCELVVKYVTPDRLTIAQCVELACAKLAPVAELGLRWLKGKPLRSADDIAALMPLANAGAPVVRGAAGEWLAAVLAQPLARPEHLRELFDARYADSRERGLGVLASEARFRDDPALWSALIESPYDDARVFILKHLEERAAELAPGGLRQLWATVLLAVHRGGRAKPVVLNQIAARVVAHPGEADALLPLVSYALRSVRPPERRAALGALARASARAPALRDAIARGLPELTLSGEVSA